MNLLAKRQPLSILRVLDRFGKENDLFSSIVDDFSHFHGFSPLRGVSNPDFSPALDITSENEKYLVTVEVPGIEKEKIDIQINEDKLVIKGEKKTEETEECYEKYVSECCYGAFRREIALPSDCDIESIKAKHENGVLTLDIPKMKEEAKEAKKISIQ